MSALLTFWSTDAKSWDSRIWHLLNSIGLEHIVVRRFTHLLTNHNWDWTENGRLAFLTTNHEVIYLIHLTRFTIPSKLSPFQYLHCQHPGNIQDILHWYFFKMIKKIYIGTTCLVMSVTCSHFKTHTHTYFIPQLLQTQNHSTRDIFITISAWLHYIDQLKHTHQHHQHKFKITEN